MLTYHDLLDIPKPPGLYEEFTPKKLKEGMSYKLALRKIRALWDKDATYLVRRDKRKGTAVALDADGTTRRIINFRLAPGINGTKTLIYLGRMDYPCRFSDSCIEDWFDDDPNNKPGKK